MEPLELSSWLAQYLDDDVERKYRPVDILYQLLKLFVALTIISGAVFILIKFKGIDPEIIISFYPTFQILEYYVLVRCIQEFIFQQHHQLVIPKQAN